MPTQVHLETPPSTCPKCKYTRKEADTAPDYRCPACGVIYEKYSRHRQMLEHPQPNRPQHPQTGWLASKRLNPYVLTLVGYLVFYLAAMTLEHHGTTFDKNQPASPLDKILFAPVMFGLVFYGLQTSSLPGRFTTIQRSEKPFTFWFNLIFYLLYGLFMLGWGLADISY